MGAVCAKLVGTVVVPNQFDGLAGLAGLADTDECCGIHYYELEDFEVSKVMGVPRKEWSAMDSPVEPHDFGGTHKRGSTDGQLHHLGKPIPCINVFGLSHQEFR